MPDSNHTVMVTGASRGLGREFVLQYAAAGWHVLAAVRDPAEAKELQSNAGSSRGRIDLVKLDVGSADSISEAFDEVAERHGSLNLLINNAGVFDPGGDAFVRRHPAQQLGALGFEDGLAVLRVNVLGAAMMCQHFLPLLRASSQARVINVSSELGALSDKTVDSSHRNYWYDTSKAALNMVTRLLAADLSSEEIVVVALVPGWVRTDMGGRGAPVETREAVAQMITTIGGLGSEHTGAYLERDGQARPW